MACFAEKSSSFRRIWVNLNFYYFDCTSLIAYVIHLRQNNNYFNGALGTKLLLFGYLSDWALLLPAYTQYLVTSLTGYPWYPVTTLTWYPITGARYSVLPDTEYCCSVHPRHHPVITYGAAGLWYIWFINKLDRKYCWMLVRLLTGHINLHYMLHKIKKLKTSSCGGRGAEKETSMYILCECPAF